MLSPARLIIPPIKCQGIKTKLVRFILSNISWNGNGRWIEPFLGSGVVLFNLQPKHVLMNEINPYIIKLYKMIYDGRLSSEKIKGYLIAEERELHLKGESHYYFVRDRFNRTGNLLDFIFLNRACFNSVIRFNRKGEFNGPFCCRVERFR